jgi:hypothetical protein
VQPPELLLALTQSSWQSMELKPLLKMKLLRFALPLR